MSARFMQSVAAMTETPAQQLARLQRSLLRHPDLEAVLGGSPLERIAARNIVPALVFHLTPSASGGRPIEPETVRFYEAAACFARSDGTVSDADLVRAADGVLPDSASRKPAKLRDRYKRGKDAAEQQAAFAFINSKAAADHYLRKLERAAAELEERERAVSERERTVAEKDADATRKYERAREALSEVVLARNLPPTSPARNTSD